MTNCNYIHALLHSPLISRFFIRRANESLISYKTFLYQTAV